METGTLVDLVKTEVDWLIDRIELVMLLRAVDEECVAGIIIVGKIPGSVPIRVVRVEYDDNVPFVHLEDNIASISVTKKHNDKNSRSC